MGFLRRLRLSAWNIVCSFDEACTTFLHWTFAAHGPWNAHSVRRSATALSTGASLESLMDFIGDEESEQATNSTATESSTYTSNYTKSGSDATSAFTPIYRRAHSASLPSSYSYDSSAYTSDNTNFEDSEATTVLASRNTSRHALGRRAPRDRDSSNPPTCLPKIVVSHNQNVNTSNSNEDSYYNSSCYGSESSAGYDTTCSTRDMYSSSGSIMSNLLGYISNKSRKKSRGEATSRGRRDRRRVSFGDNALRNTAGRPLQYTSQKQHTTMGTHEKSKTHPCPHNMALKELRSIAQFGENRNDNPLPSF